MEGALPKFRALMPTIEDMKLWEWDDLAEFTAYADELCEEAPGKYFHLDMNFYLPGEKA